MNLLLALHGTAAAILICCLLIVDEAGIPLPIAPNEALLLLVGVLVAGGAFPLWAILPAAYISMALGMFLGYGWARAVGQSGLQSLAASVKAEKMYGRAQDRLQSASIWQIALARMVPALRPYATLVSGAAEVELRTFALAALPALAIWEIILVVAGMLIGLPLEYLLRRVEKIVLGSGILVALAIVAWLATRHSVSGDRGGIAYLAVRVRALLALSVDAVMVLAVVGGLDVIGGRITHHYLSGWSELLISAVLLAVLLIVARSITTPGEALFNTEYWHRSSAVGT